MDSLFSPLKANSASECHIGTAVLSKIEQRKNSRHGKLASFLFHGEVGDA